MGNRKRASSGKRGLQTSTTSPKNILQYKNMILILDPLSSSSKMTVK